MHRVVRWIWVVALAAACGGNGSDEAAEPAVVDSAAYQNRVAAELQPGMTKDEVRERLGEPRTRVTMGAGLERWTYWNYDPQGNVAARTMIIFGDDGRIAEINDM